MKFIYLKRLLIGILVVSLIIVLFIKITHGTIAPWKVVYFSSMLKEENHINNGASKIKQLREKYKEYYINNTLIEAGSEATDETLYSGKDPYRLIFRFWTLDGEKTFTIKSIEILNDDLNYAYENLNYEGMIKKRSVLNGSNWEESLSEFALGVYYTPYDFDLYDYNSDIHVRLLGAIDNENIDLEINLTKYEKKGFIRWGY